MCQVHCCTVFENQLYLRHILLGGLQLYLICWLDQFIANERTTGDKGAHIQQKNAKLLFCHLSEFDTGNGHLMSGKRMQSYNSFTSVSVTLASHVQQITILSPFQYSVRAEGFTVNILAEYNMIDPRPFGLLTCTFHKCICDIFLISNHQENSVEEFRPKIEQRS